ncbi:sterol desaturase family protein [Qipengyuania nanhaisediminis]|uniref:sterol desaturase family protein n=1 Tax=Qipengyuania nanhaisediminis TaxID=604088 RepID=UPI0038B25985
MIPAGLPPLLALTLAGLAVSAIVLARYFASSGLFAWLTARAHPGLYRGLGKQIRREIGWSAIAALIYGVPAGAVLWLWSNRQATLIYTDWTAFPAWYLPLSVFAYLFVQDSWFYWSHRAMHASPLLFRHAHAVHHQSRPPTAWTAMSFHPLESLSGAIVVPLLVFVVPIHIAMLALVLAIATIMGVTNHMGWEMFPRCIVHSRFGQWVITASHHERHHEDYRCNYGLYFRVWDRLCGTDRGLSEKLVRRGRAAA